MMNKISRVNQGVVKQQNYNRHNFLTDEEGTLGKQRCDSSEGY